MTDLATITAILYAARLSRRVPETDAEKRGTIAASVADARLIVEIVGVSHFATSNDAAKRDMPPVSTPEQPPPSPGTIGRKAEAKAPRRRG